LGCSCCPDGAAKPGIPDKNWDTYCTLSSVDEPDEDENTAKCEHHKESCGTRKILVGKSLLSGTLKNSNSIPKGDNCQYSFSFEDGFEPNENDLITFTA